ncbi:MAG: cyclodeaminase/cyclohydrolase family protein [Oscillospiraceae bacterium]|jgi:formiminotetrahydrofolate cyclodeaminase|nr:cyclodeaminase/cyclohydrolase family protein [Oscillospiraceae bacterium]
MSFVRNTCTEFVEALASKSSVPGGGGASALVGAVGMALGSMVGSLTVGKKKYADVEAEIVAIMEKAANIQAELLRLVDEDAIVFEPLSKAYGIPKDDPNREQVMEDALKLACSVPMDIMRACAAAIELLDEFAKKGSALAISDAGVGVAFCKAALMGASLNVFINTKSMNDKGYAANIETEADGLLDKYCAKADEIYGSVLARLR